jgi:hypothetical protein
MKSALLLSNSVVLECYLVKSFAGYSVLDIHVVLFIVPCEDSLMTALCVTAAVHGSHALYEHPS